MIIKFKDDEKKVEFTFNSFKYLEDLDLADLENIKRKPFKIISFCEMLLFAGLNHNPKVVVPLSFVDEYLEDTMSNGDISKVLEELVEELTNSNFFKKLQEKNQ